MKFIVAMTSIIIIIKIQVTSFEHTCKNPNSLKIWNM